MSQQTPSKKPYVTSWNKGIQNGNHRTSWQISVKKKWQLWRKLSLVRYNFLGWNITQAAFRVSTKARLHMRFLMRFRIQNVPDPTLHECLFREASCGLERKVERKVSHIIWRHPSFEFLPTWRYFVAALRNYRPMRGRLGQILCAKSHQNRTKIASKIACVNGP